MALVLTSGLHGAMRGHVVRRGNAWRVHVYLGRDSATGKQRYLTRTVHGTKREAEKVCATLAAEASRGQFGTRASGTVAALLDAWLAHIEPDASPSTIATYRGYVARWIVPRLGNKKLDRLRPDDLDRLYTELRKHLSPPVSSRSTPSCGPPSAKPCGGGC